MIDPGGSDPQRRSALLDRIVGAEGAREWRAHWPVVLAAMTGFGASYIHAYSLGVVIPSIESELGWSRARITSGLLIVSLIVFPLAPALGMMVDRVGPRRVALAGLPLYGASLAGLSLVQQSILTWWGLWIAVALGHLLLNATVWVAAISSLFKASRGLALALTLSATGFVSFCVPLATHVLIEQFGWRMTYVLWGALSISVALPALYFFFSSEKDKIRTAPSQPFASSPPAAILSGLTAREGYRSSAFQKMAAVTFMISVANVALLVHLVPILSSLGMKASTAAATAGIFGIFQISGRLLAGTLLDRFNARAVSAISMLLPAAVCLLLLGSGGGQAVVTLAVILFGLAMGAELDVIAYLGSRYFGNRAFGTIFGGMIALMTLGVGLGPFLASIVYDRTGGYALVLWAAIPLSLISTWLLSTLGPYPIFDEQAAKEKSVPS